MKKKTALVLGGTGLVGRYIVKDLLEHPAYDKVICVQRRMIEVDHPKLESIAYDLDQLSLLQLPPLDEYFCALGSTMKKAKTRENFKKVDVTYVVEGAKVAQRFGAKSCAIVSAVGAHKNSVVFYSRCKGIMEEQIYELGFKHCFFARPSIILGNRGENRLMENLFKTGMQKSSFLFRGPFSKYKAVHASEIARRMVVEMQNAVLPQKVLFFK